MALPCKVCTSGKREEIDRALLEGQPLRTVARSFFGTIKVEDSLQRHRKKHLPNRLARALAARQEATGADELLDRLSELTRETAEILASARDSGRDGIALKAIARLETQMELQARLLGQLRDQQVNVLSVSLDAETAVKMAETYLRRRSLALPAALE